MHDFKELNGPICVTCFIPTLEENSKSVVEWINSSCPPQYGCVSRDVRDVHVVNK